MGYLLPHKYCSLYCVRRFFRRIPHVASSPSPSDAADPRKAPKGCGTPGCTATAAQPWEMSHKPLSAREFKRFLYFRGRERGHEARWPPRGFTGSPATPAFHRDAAVQALGGGGCWLRVGTKATPGSRPDRSGEPGGQDTSSLLHACTSLYFCCEAQGVLS